MGKQLFFAVLLLVAISAASPFYYCSTTCIDYMGACFDQTPQGCYVCANRIFNSNAVLGSSTPCTVAPQTTVLANELSNTAMSLFGYSTSNPNPLTCTNYTFSGQYVDSDYLSKNFTGIPLNHYALVIRFGVGYLGTWSSSDVLRLNLQDSLQSVDYDYGYSCQYRENICGESYNSTDCIRIREYYMVHNTSFVFLNFTALTTETNSIIQSWGIKELIVAAKLCHAYCLTCYGGTNNNCLSCSAGFFLQGNVCLPTCNPGLYQVVDAGLCVSVCPQSYYPTMNVTDNSLICQKCMAGCLVCASGSICQAWDDISAYVPNLWTDKMEFWILLIIVVVGLISFGVYKIVKKTLAKPTDLEEKLNSGDEKGSGEGKDKISDKSQRKEEEDIKHQSESKLHLGNDSMVQTINQMARPESNLWFNELVELEPTEMKVVRPRRKRRSPNELEKPQSNSDTLEIGTSNAEL